MGDLSPRAIDALRTADAICCEDSRRTGRLLAHAGIERSSPLLVVNDHTEAARIGDVLARLARGERVAVVTDAGMPGISDPGERLVRAAAVDGYVVEVVPGPSAAVAALVASGLPTGRFVFEGFLPRKGSGRTQRLSELADERRTVVIYEAPHRLARTLADLVDAFGGDRQVAIARELTKLHEELRRGTLEELARHYQAGGETRGEIAIVIAPPREAAPGAEDVDALLRAAMARVSLKDAVAEVAAATGEPRRSVYGRALELAKDGDGEAR
jgi:16S rRNA (cytidine1402-2'-O)-methyltransferase